MTSATAPGSGQREPDLAGQTVVVIGGSSGIGLETARRARTEGADVIIAGRNPDRLKRAAAEVGAERTAAFDATDSGQLETFFQQLPTPIDHVLVTGPGPRSPRRCSARTSKLAATSSARRCRSDGWSAPQTSPRSPCTSWPTPP